MNRMPRFASQGPSSDQGFTLIELMVSVAVAGNSQSYLIASSPC